MQKGQYAVITAAYWAFTLTDGALRMLVLLYLYGNGYSALAIAGLFLFYEFFGIVTNLAGAALAARFGLRSTLLLGLTLQVVALGVLGAFHADLSLLLVMGMQSLSGIAKDLTKMSSKSFMKFLVPSADRAGLMRIVAWLTGSKNTLKGAGFFLGGWLLANVGFRDGCFWMAGGLVIALALSLWRLPRQEGQAKQVGSIGDWWKADPRVLWLSLTRMALFASRDVWFVLALPLYLSSQWNWGHSQVGGFLAVWVIGYGLIQALAPGWIRSTDMAQRSAGVALGGWSLLLLAPLLGLLYWGLGAGSQLFLGLGVFALVFATCSALHSYLILAFADGQRVAQQVGAYYASNAAGRFLGTALSGWLYHRAGAPEEGLRQALWGSVALVGLASVLCLPLVLVERKHRRA